MCDHYKKDSYESWGQANGVAANEERAWRLGGRRNTLTVYQCRGCYRFMVTKSKIRLKGRAYNREIEKRKIERYISRILGG